MYESNIELIYVSNEDRGILRELAKQVIELVAQPVEKEKFKLWKKLNSFEWTRPLIICDPQNGWIELVKPDDLKCTGILAREWEESLQREIYLGLKIVHDKMIMTCFYVPHIYTETDWGMHENKIGGKVRGAYMWEAPLQDYERDFGKLRFPEIKIHEAETKRIMDIAQDVFADIMPVQRSTGWYWTLGITYEVAKLRGLEQIMLDMYDFPDEFHALMAFVRDGLNAKLDFLEKNNLLTLSMPQKDFDGKHVRTMDVGGFAESQETLGVSPEMFERFIFPYQYSLLQRFAFNHYGCCEPLDTRIDIVMRFPRLRKISVSPWANLELMAEKLKSEYIMFYKPNPAYLAVEHLNEEFIRKTMRETFRITRECHVQVCLADTNTFCNNPDNLIRWSHIAMEEAEAL